MIKCSAKHEFETPTRIIPWPGFPGHFSGDCPVCGTSFGCHQDENGKWQKSTSEQLLKAREKGRMSVPNKGD